jgi:hypothetical protein
LTAGKIRIVSQLYINRVAVPRNQLPFQYVLEYFSKLAGFIQNLACSHSANNNSNMHAWQDTPNLATTSRAENRTVFRKFYSYITVTPANPNVLICSEYVNYMFVTIYQLTMCVFI